MKKAIKFLTVIMLLGTTSISKAQKVGIGTNAPQFQMHVVGNIMVDSLAIGTTLPSKRIVIDGQTIIHDDHFLEFGGGIAKETMAGKIHFNAFESPYANTFLRIYGAGTTVNNRKLKFFAEGGSLFTGGINANGIVSANNIKITNFFLKSLRVNPLSGQSPFVIKDVGPTNRLEVNSNGNIGIGINNPPSNDCCANSKTFHVNGDIKTDTLFASILGGRYNVNWPGTGLTKYASSSTNLKFDGNSTFQIANTGEVNGGTIGYQTFSDGLDIVGIGSSNNNRSINILSDDFYAFGNFEVATRTIIDSLYTNDTLHTQKLILGYNKLEFKDIRHGTFEAGSGLPDTLVKVVTLTFPQPFSHLSKQKIFATARAENNAQDIFSITLTEIKEHTVKFIIRRMDIDESDLAPGQLGWAQNLHIDWWASQ